MKNNIPRTKAAPAAAMLLVACLCSCTTVTGPNGKQRTYLSPAGKELISGVIGTGVGAGVGALVGGGGKGAMTGAAGAAAGQLGNFATRSFLPSAPSYPQPYYSSNNQAIR